MDHIIKHFTLVTLIFLGLSFQVKAHDVIINKNTNLRTEASATSNDTIIQLLSPGTEVTLIDRLKENGYYHVIHSELGKGFIWGRNVTVIQEYWRDEWKHWTDEDRDCQNTRDEVLIAESEIDVTFKDNKTCKVIAGRWTDPFSGEIFTDPKQLDIDHMVPLKNAHQSGGWRWDYQRRRAYANDLTVSHHLIAVKKSLNSSKGARGPDQWLPPNTAYLCDYVTNWENIKTTWQLIIKEAEQAAIDRVKAEHCQ